MKKKLGLIIGIIVLILIITAILIMKPKSKTGKKIEDILAYNEYETYYTYGGNTYDKNGNCHSYDHEIEDCTRETKTWNFISFDIVNKNNKANKITMLVTFDSKNQIKEKIIGYEKQDKYPKYRYSSNDKKTENYLIYDNKETYCYKINTTKTLKKDKIDICTKTPSLELEKFEEQYKQELKDLGITEQDLYNYTDWYYEKNAKRKFLDSKKTITPLSYEQIEKNIKKHEYQIEKTEDAIVVEYKLELGGTTYNYTIFRIQFEKEKLTSIVYGNSIYEKLYIFYDIPNKIYYGTDTDNTCVYIVKPEDQKTTCTEQRQRDLKIVLDLYQSDLQRLEITEEEMIEYAKEFYQKNK